MHFNYLNMILEVLKIENHNKNIKSDSKDDKHIGNKSDESKSDENKTDENKLEKTKDDENRAEKKNADENKPEKIETCYFCLKKFDINKDDLSHYKYGEYPMCDYCAQFYGFYSD